VQKFTLLCIVASFAVWVPAGLRAEPAPDPVVVSYVSASQGQQERLLGASMQVDIQAELPKLHRFGRLRALRHVSRLGRLTYEALGFEGDRSIKTDVIARYLTAEVQASEKKDPSMAITPANYKFRYKARLQSDAQNVYIYQLTPRKKRVGLFKGELWIDATTFLPVRESGRFVKSPSVFLKKIEFVREYENINGVAVPKRIETRTHTRLVGQAQITIEFGNYAWEDAAESVPVAALSGEAY